MYRAPLPPMTRHFVERASLRHLRRDVLEFVLAFGAVTDAVDALHYTLVERELPPDLAGSELARRARDWVIVASRDTGALITCYRCESATRFLKRKSERRFTARRAA